MTMSKTDRRSSHKKQERSQIKSGVPSIGDLKEGVTVFRFNNKLTQYVKHKGILYTSEWNKVGAPTPEPTTEPTTAKVYFSDILETSSQFDPQDIDVPGYLTFSNGLIIQWGTSGSIAVGGTSVITFPIAFPNAALNAQASNKGGGESSSVGINGLSTTQITLYVPSIDSDARQYYWMAIGH